MTKKEIVELLNKEHDTHRALCDDFDSCRDCRLDEYDEVLYLSNCMTCFSICFVLRNLKNERKTDKELIDLLVLEAKEFKRFCNKKML